MPPKRLLSHYKVDARMNRLITTSCNAEDMLLRLLVLLHFMVLIE